MNKKSWKFGIKCLAASKKQMGYALKLVFQNMGLGLLKLYQLLSVQKLIQSTTTDNVLYPMQSK